MFRRPLPLVSLVAVSLVFSLLVGEAALRTFGYEPRRLALNTSFWSTGWAAMDEELGWRNREGSFRSAEPGHALMSFESDGRRHDPSSKVPDLPKVVVVGCSFTQGEGVPDDQPYPHLVNLALPGFEVINYGTGGYGTYQSLLRLRAYFRSPHPPTPLVLYGYTSHHITRNVATTDWVSMLTTRDGRYLMPPHVRAAGDGIREYTSRPVELWPLEQRSALVALAHKAAMNTSLHVRWSERFAVTQQVLRDMNTIARANKSSLTVIGLVALSDAEIERMKHDGIDYLDCQYPGPLHRDLQVGGWGHPNGRMHEWWGTCIVRGLAAR